MLQPLKQLNRVQECEIQLPASMHEDGFVHRLIRGRKSEERFLEADFQVGFKPPGDDSKAE